MARAIWRHSFERDRDFIVFRRPLTICGQEFAPGESFDKALVPTRKLRQLFEAHRIMFADVEKPGALPDVPKPPKVKKPKASSNAAPKPKRVKADPLDHDGNGKKGGAVDPNLAKLRADYLAVVGKKPFGGWKADELQKRIDAALAV